jgi:hypothetical protein
MDPNIVWRQTEARIDRAWYAAVVAAVFTIILGLMRLGTYGTVAAHEVALFGDATFVLGLAWGVARRSRVAAGLLLAHLALTVLALVQGEAYGSALIAAGLFGPLYGLGLHGVLTYHRLRAALQADVAGLTSQSP